MAATAETIGSAFLLLTVLLLITMRWLERNRTITARWAWFVLLALSSIGACFPAVFLHNNKIEPSTSSSK